MAACTESFPSLHTSLILEQLPTKLAPANSHQIPPFQPRINFLRPQKHSFEVLEDVRLPRPDSLR
ncbi:hypothetical protein LINPERPRIM_LOCUS22025 [Linum perenne]